MKSPTIIHGFGGWLIIFSMLEEAIFMWIGRYKLQSVNGILCSINVTEYSNGIFIMISFEEIFDFI